MYRDHARSDNHAAAHEQRQSHPKGRASDAVDWWIVDWWVDWIGVRFVEKPSQRRNNDGPESREADPRSTNLTPQRQCVTAPAP